MSKEELQKLFIEFQELNQLSQQLEKQGTMLNNQLMETMLAKQNLDELKEVEEGTEILVPISNGVYAKANIKDTKNFVVNIGAEVTIPKTTEETQAMMQKQIDDIKEMQEALEKEMQENSVKATMLEQKIKELASKE